MRSGILPVWYFRCLPRVDARRRRERPHALPAPRVPYERRAGARTILRRESPPISAARAAGWMRVRPNEAGIRGRPPIFSQGVAWAALGPPRHPANILRMISVHNPKTVLRVGPAGGERRTSSVPRGSRGRPQIAGIGAAARVTDKGHCRSYSEGRVGERGAGQVLAAHHLGPRRGAAARLQRLLPRPHRRVHL